MPTNNTGWAGLTRPCRTVGEGTFLLTFAVYLALWSYAFFGADFWSLTVGFLRAPFHPPFGLLVIVGMAATGLWFVGVIINETIQGTLIHAEDVPPEKSAIVGVGAALAFLCGLTLPRSWGVWLWWGSRGALIALFTASLASLLFVLGSKLWGQGFEAGADAALRFAVPAPSPEPVPDLSARQAVIDRQATTIGRLTVERDALAQKLEQRQAVINRQGTTIEQLTEERDALAVKLKFMPPAPEVQTMLRWPGVRAAVLAVLHPDKAKTESDRQTRTTRFQVANSIFEKLTVKS